LLTGVVRVGLGGRGWSPGLDVGVFHVGLGCAVAAACQGVVVVGGPLVRMNSWVQACCQGQFVGRCRVRRLAEDAIRAGMVISLRRMVAVVALAIAVPAAVAAARVRLNAMTARTSQAAFAVNDPDGRLATAEFFRSACACSMMA